MILFSGEVLRGDRIVNTLYEVWEVVNGIQYHYEVFQFQKVYA